MKCKNCGAPVEEGQLECPSCGVCMEVKKVKKLSKKAIISIIAVSLVVVLLASAVGTALLMLKPWKNDVHNKDTYVVSDFWAKAAHDQVVATMGDYELTNGRLQVFYWMMVYDLIEYYTNQYGDYATYYLGIDLSKPLSEQIYMANENMTWEQYFLEDAFFAWRRYQSLTDEAKKAGYQMPAEYQKELADMRTEMEASAKQQGFSSVDAMIQANLGSTVTFEDFYYYQEVYYISNLYFSELTSKLVFTDAELEAFFEKNKESLEEYGITKASGNLVDVRNILVKPVSSKDENGKAVITDEAWDNCLTKAQAIMETLQGTELSEDVFANLAKIKSEDSNTAANGGLNQYIGKNTLATVDARHILIMPKGGTKGEDGTTITYSDEEWEACRVEAQKLLDQYLAGEKTEKAFGELANKHSEDQDGKVTNGGLYSDIYVGQMVKPFEQWIFDGSRQPGDTGLVKTQYGYHVMYFVSRTGPVDEWLFAQGRKAGDLEMIKTKAGYEIVYYVGDDVAWEVWCREGLLSQTSQEMMESYSSAREIDIRYWAITLSERATASK